jgi:hypothetical protein
MIRLSKKFIKKLALLLTLLLLVGAAGSACDNGFFVISCYQFGSPSFCLLGYYSGVMLWAYGSTTLNDCSDCSHTAGHDVSYIGELDCSGETMWFYGYGCCGLN